MILSIFLSLGISHNLFTGIELKQYFIMKNRNGFYSSLLLIHNLLISPQLLTNTIENDKEYYNFE